MVGQCRFSPNDLIIREGYPGESAFYIESGKVEVFKDGGGRKVHIAYLGPGSTFGEMSMVDDLPRSASVIAVEDTVVSEFHRDDLFIAMRENPEVFGRFLKPIFERLREANRKLAALDPDALAQQAKWLANLKDPGAASDRWFIEGLTPEAIYGIGASPAPIASFPFKIGRKSADPFLYNHLEIQDSVPSQISRHHVTLERNGDGVVGVVDRGSDKGAVVDGTRIGGRHGAGPVWLKAREGLLVLGDDDSPYRYRIGVTRE
jgi:hypothetical protein